MDDPRQTIGAISERTLANVRRAKAFGARIKTVNIVWKFWTDYTRFKPEYYDAITTWWERSGPPYQVRWIKVYWLRFGVSIYWPIERDPHERMNHVV